MKDLEYSATISEHADGTFSIFVGYTWFEPAKDDNDKFGGHCHQGIDEVGQLQDNLITFRSKISRQKVDVSIDNWMAFCYPWFMDKAQYLEYLIRLAPEEVYGHDFSEWALESMARHDANEDVVDQTEITDETVPF